ncbi:hypothetical protein NQ317_005118 [Molorchus minor]|uniref:Uncharacterized protein n=1 Tax=Molorchus minor TaxID=1323400 RepID=A0ABQ9IT86_9CUCU|nr:hypothetical protein NQ317_005118 [Molorchus minor]
MLDVQRLLGIFISVTSWCRFCYKNIWNPKTQWNKTLAFLSVAGSIARKALQSLEALKLIEKSPDGGRKLIQQGSNIAAQVKAKERKALKASAVLALCRACRGWGEGDRNGAPTSGGAKGRLVCANLRKV